jgi:hypothetical protein
LKEGFEFGEMARRTQAERAKCREAVFRTIDAFSDSLNL